MSADPQRASPEAVVVVGVGMTAVGEHWDRSLRDLALEAIQAARSEAPDVDPQALYVANALSPALSRQVHVAALVADYAGLRGIEAVTVEAAGASGGAALRQAYLALASGQLRAALVVGVEKVTDKVGGALDAALAMAEDSDYEAVHGLTPTAQAAMLMRRYLHEFGAPADALAGFSLTAHTNAVHNPHAMFRKAIRAEDYAKAQMVSEPVNMYDAAPLADGAAALLLRRAEAVPGSATGPRVRIAGSALASSALALHDQPDPLWLDAAAISAERAFNRAGLTREDVAFIELHDTFSIYAALQLEALGFAGRGQGWQLARNGAISRAGTIPVCTWGGSKARGDVGGATGVYQAAEAALQLLSRAGENQVEGARAGLIQCLGGPGATAATHILVRDG
jgi:acetyl-CoA C-acetyltransferase